MLLGTYPAKLATNHRVGVPAPLRKALGENIVIAKWYEECLVLVAESSLNALLTRVTGKQGLITAPVRGSEHFIFSSAFEVVPDDQGRIVIPEDLVKYAGLSEDIYFLGVGDRVEVWEKQIWDEKVKTIVKEAPEYIEELSKKEK
ncbi:MAG: Protein MraZ [Candidatus Woesebacteria bacterium GW2011_GWA2_40_7b]|uniref:Transcriptional regulator MraZ n=1 Tax=Candidatus Woesebacteria bacterium GW2011_GWA2_40_7b TaxID=1618563 RepID=A0A0G0T267_9BACT|nr:MAG: Protein MraZ [Candidatus Woesebacteria bacterium GW2011_GWA2_40_7b]